MPFSAPQAQPGPTTTRAPLDRAPVTHRSAGRDARSAPVTDCLVASTLTWTILELEEHLIPAQGAGDVLYVYAGDIVVTHDIRRTLEVFEGNADEAVNNIRSFVLDGILGNPNRAC